MGPLRVGFQADARCALGGLGSDIDANINWLRVEVQKFIQSESPPAFGVISIGGNTLAKPSRSGEQAVLRDNLLAAQRECTNGVRKLL